ncbi:hypothetical protein QYF61_019245 [Mycteria americana]|uniref:Uncharacterized protein n=1 Tax=Mycteria americana TaxID=33587 RepID=A0AAN7S8Y4_MYCAM|nr:hypothetical protein QYF61_019245 [Mycteria americana]
MCPCSKDVHQRPERAETGLEQRRLKGILSMCAKQSQFPQPLLIRLLLQTLHQLRCPSLDTLQHLNVSLVVRGPKLNTIVEVRPHQCRVQGHDHFPSPAGHAIPDTSQDAIGFLDHLGSLCAHVHPAIDQPSQLSSHSSQVCSVHGVVVTQVQDLALGLVEPHTIGLSPWIQPVQVPLQSLPTLKKINTPAQLGVICKLTEGALNPLVQIIDKGIKQNWPQHRALGNTNCDWLPTGFNSVHHNALGLAIQPLGIYAKLDSCIPSNRNPIDIKLNFGTHVIITDLKDKTDLKAIPCPQIHHYRKLPVVSLIYEFVPSGTTLYAEVHEMSLESTKHIKTG